MARDQTVDSLSTLVVCALADADDTDPFDMEPPLFRSVDLDALDRLVRPGSDVRVEFEYEGHAVTVTGDGTVTVDGDPFGGRDWSDGDDEPRI